MRRFGTWLTYFCVDDEPIMEEILSFFPLSRLYLELHDSVVIDLMKHLPSPTPCPTPSPTPSPIASAV